MNSLSVSFQPTAKKQAKVFTDFLENSPVNRGGVALFFFHFLFPYLGTLLGYGKKQ